MISRYQNMKFKTYGNQNIFSAYDSLDLRNQKMIQMREHRGISGDDTSSYTGLKAKIDLYSLIFFCENKVTKENYFEVFTYICESRN